MAARFPTSVFIASVGQVAHGALGAARRNPTQDEMAGQNGGLGGMSLVRAGLRAKRTGPRLGWMRSNRLLVFRRVIPRVAAGIAVGTAGRGFGVAKAFLAGLFAGRTDWSFAGAAGFTLSARFASRGFSTTLVTLRQHLSAQRTIIIISFSFLFVSFSFLSLFHFSFFIFHFHFHFSFFIFHFSFFIFHFLFFIFHFSFFIFHFSFSFIFFSFIFFFFMALNGG